MDKELVGIIKMVLEGADGALIFVILWLMRDIRGWVAKVERAMEHIEDVRQTVIENSKDIEKLRRMVYAIKSEMRNGKEAEDS